MRLQAISFLSIFIGLKYLTTASTVDHHAIRPVPFSPTIASIHDFPVGTWVENLAVRANGQILATLLNTPQVYLVEPNPSAAHPATLVHTFPGYLGCLGITELGHDIFYVVTGNFSPQTAATTPGSYSVWKLNMAGFKAGGTPAAATKIADFPQSGLLNGMTALQPSRGGHTLLIADSGVGAIWSIDVNTRVVNKIITDPLMAPTSGTSLHAGINGLKVANQSLYFSNTNQALLAKVALNLDGSAKGPATVVVRNVPGVDDLQTDSLGDSFIAGDNGLRFHSIREGSAGPPDIVSNSSLLAGSTAVAFGRLPTDLAGVYVATSGGQAQYVSGQFTNPGKIVRVDLLAVR